MKMETFAAKLSKHYPDFACREWGPDFDTACDAMALELGLPVRADDEGSWQFLERLWDGINNYHALKEVRDAKTAQAAALKTSPNDQVPYGGDWS